MQKGRENSLTMVEKTMEINLEHVGNAKATVPWNRWNQQLVYGVSTCNGPFLCSLGPFNLEDTLSRQYLLKTVYVFIALTIVLKLRKIFY